MAELLPSPPARVLDIGCGTGGLSLAMAQAGYVATAIDPDPIAIQLAVRSAHQAGPVPVAYHRSDVATYVPDAAGFDVVVACRTLRHVREPAASLDRVRRWLRPGGHLVCIDSFHDRFDRRDARRVAQLRGQLEATGACRPS